MVLEESDIPIRKKININPHIRHKIISKWIIDLSIKTKIIMPLEENIE